MIRLIMMILGTVLALLFCIQLLLGLKYDKYVRGLDGMEFPMKDLFVVGFVWQAFPLCALKGQRKDVLFQSASLVYEPQYASYYANVTWAQVLTYAHLGFTLTCLLSALLFGNFMYVFGVGMFITIFFIVYAYTAMSNKVSERREKCEAELANAVSTMAILLNSGMILRDVWTLVSAGDGPLYELMRFTREDMNNGMSEVDAICQFGRRSDSAEIKRFSSNMVQSIENGG